MFSRKGILLADYVGKRPGSRKFVFYARSCGREGLGQAIRYFSRYPLP